MSPSIEPLTLTPRQAAQYLGLGKTKMLELIRSKRIAVYMLDGRIRVSTETCKAFLATLPTRYVKGKEVNRLGSRHKEVSR